VTYPVLERERLIRAYATGRYTLAELAEAFDVSRKTASKWVHRVVEEGPAGLLDRSRAPHRHPNATPEDVVAAVLRKKEAHPTWGSLKLLPGPEDPVEVCENWPAPSTRALILSRAGYTQPRRRKRRVQPFTQPFSSCEESNAVWCADFKGWFRTTDGERCDPLTVTDAYSRMLLCCRALPRPDYAHVRKAFESLFEEYGLPQAIRTDNGPPFASVAAGGLSPLAAWWVKLGIHPERIQPGHPEQNGRHERMHLTLKLECCKPPAPTIAAQQARFDAFRQVFNHERPHQALGLRPPGTSYSPSTRLYRPWELDDPAYPAHATIRRVRSNGEIKWRGRKVFISEALIREAVSLTETAAGHDVHFGPILLGHLYGHQERLTRPVNHTSKSSSVTHVLR
jgi:transposase InsO family protein/transposase-like protein